MFVNIIKQLKYNINRKYKNEKQNIIIKILIETNHVLMNLIKQLQNNINKRKRKLNTLLILLIKINNLFFNTYNLDSWGSSAVIGFFLLNRFLACASHFAVIVEISWSGTQLYFLSLLIASKNITKILDKQFSKIAIKNLNTHSISNG